MQFSTAHISSIIIGALTLFGGAHAADIHAEVIGDGTYAQIVIEGEIAEGDCERMERILKENQGKAGIIYPFVPGGDFDEAMKMGRVIRALELTSTAPHLGSNGKPVIFDSSPKLRNEGNRTCVGAGVFLHVAGIYRNGTALFVHRPALTREHIRMLGADLAKPSYEALQRRAAAYLSEMNVSEKISDAINASPPDQPKLLDEALVKAHLWGDLPHRADWLAATCDRMTNEQKKRYRELSSQNLASSFKMAVGDFPANAHALTPTEDKELLRLTELKKQDSERNIAATTQGREAAYTKYFGIAPSDTADHNFERWTQVTKYLGQRFDTLQAEERFTPKTTSIGHDAKMHTLSRSATATAPSLTLFDSPLKQMVVESVSVLSSNNPSTTFKAQLIQHLTAQWGNPTESNHTDTWSWTGPNFISTLKLEPVSGTVSCLALKLERRRE